MQYLKGHAKKAPALTERGFIMYQGSSMLDNAPIVVIATMSTSNVKTGQMVQTWILRADINPVEASQTGDDASICGNCVHRHYNKGACYVNIGQAPNAVYKGFQRGIYPVFSFDDHAHYFASPENQTWRIRRSGRRSVWCNAINCRARHRSYRLYTHQADHKGFDGRYFELCQVSADTPRQAAKYQKLGAKTFRVALAGDALANGELECLADSKGLQCIDCMLCDGSTKNIAITVHGSRSNRFKSNLIAVGG
jgi:hypothetical protein